MGDLKFSLESIAQTKLKEISVPNGNVMHAMKSSDQGYVSFGEAYFSKIDPGAIKAWKKHKEMNLNLVVPIGEVMFVFSDGAGSFRVITIGESNYSRISVPPNIWFGFKGLSSGTNIILNIADIQHDPSEIERRPEEFFEYNWGV